MGRLYREQAVGKVKDSIKANADDQLIIDGYPLLDPKSGNAIILATNVKSVMLDRAERAAKKPA